MFTPFSNSSADPTIHGFLHEPAKPNGSAIVLTHGAGANCQSKLLIAVSDALATAGLTVLRFDLPFRNERPHGPPRPGSAARDRDGLRRAVALMKEKKYKQTFMGGHSYGGRQSTILASEEPHLVDGLLLLSYPLHPPQKPEQLRTSHFPNLNTPAFFAHGTKDPFGSIAEMNSALQLIPARHILFEVENAGHDLLAKKSVDDLPLRIAREFLAFLPSR
jgi:uncharacterized protein